MKKILIFFISGLAIALFWIAIEFSEKSFGYTLPEPLWYIKLVTWPFHVLSIGFKYTPESFLWFNVRAALYNGVLYLIVGSIARGILRMFSPKK